MLDFIHSFACKKNGTLKTTSNHFESSIYKEKNRKRETEIETEIYDSRERLTQLAHLYGWLCVRDAYAHYTIVSIIFVARERMNCLIQYNIQLA